MGFYDNRCSLTGVSLWCNQAVLILVEPDGNSFRPVTLGVKGSCNRFGSIDFFEDDANVSAICAYFRAKLTSKELSIHDDYYLPKGDSTAKDVEQFFQAFERNTSEGDSNGLPDRPLTPALISQNIWDGVVARNNVSGTPEEHFARIFAAGDIPRAIYGTNLSKLQEILSEQAAVCDFMVRHKVTWQPSEIYGQGDAHEVRKFLRDAQEKFRASPAMLEILATYAAFMEAKMAEFKDR